MPKIPVVTADNLYVDGCLIAGHRSIVSEIRGFFKSSSLPSRMSVRGAMKINLLSARAWLKVPRTWMLVLGSAAVCSSAVGCQTTVGGQTLPSAYYLKDDLAYFPPGPEFKLTKQVQALEEYRLRQQGATAEEQP
jgi:hypothetical protein